MTDRERRIIAEDSAPVVEMRAIPVAADDAEPAGRGSLIAAVRDHDPGRSDAMDGCEFVDDRIRLQE